MSFRPFLSGALWRCADHSGFGRIIFLARRVLYCFCQVVGAQCICARFTSSRRRDERQVEIACDPTVWWKSKFSPDWCIIFRKFYLSDRRWNQVGCCETDAPQYSIVRFNLSWMRKPRGWSSKK